MKFFPKEDFYIISPLKPSEVQVALEKEVTAKNAGISGFFAPLAETYFEGYAVNGFFDMQPVIKGRNSFIPQIKGRVEPYLNGSRIRVKMNLMTGVLAFMCIWLAFAFLFGLGFIFQSLKNNDFSFAILIPFGMMLFGYCLTLGGFKFESVGAKEKLLEMFEGTIE